MFRLPTTLPLAGFLILALATPAQAGYFEYRHRIQSNQVQVTGLSPYGDTCSKVYFYVNFLTVNSSNMYVKSVSIRNTTSYGWYGEWYFRGADGRALAGGGGRNVPAGAWYTYTIGRWVGRSAATSANYQLSNWSSGVCGHNGYITYVPFW